MRTHPLWNRFETPSEEDINAARVQPGVWEPAPVDVVVADPAWPQWYAAARERIVAALGERMLAIDHVGSTSVPGLWAKHPGQQRLTQSPASAAKVRLTAYGRWWVSAEPDARLQPGADRIGIRSGPGRTS